MARPAILCKLQKGTLIDAQPHFVDTFNWMVDFINNLKGEGEIKPNESTLVVDRTDTAAPVIRGGGKGGGGELTVTGTDLSTAKGNDILISSSEGNIDAAVTQGSSGSMTIDLSAKKLSVTGTDGSSAEGRYLRFVSASDAKIKVSVSGSGDTITVTVGAYYI